MDILLLKPRWQSLTGHEQVRYAQNVRFPALGLGIVAALSEGHEVRIADENWDELPLDEPFDLVGITATTFAAERVFELADHFRARRIPVVIGGVHAAIQPDECLEHADAVVIGEAETTWPQVLLDAERGRLQPRYKAREPTDMRRVPLPRRALLNEWSWFTAVEATRGCPNKCRYCYLPSVPWHKHRTRPVEIVAEEIRNLPQKAFIFVDENLFADRDYALRLFRTIAPFRKFFLVQCPTNVSGDEELLDALAAAGCFNVQVGFQSFNRAVLEEARVYHHRLDQYRDLVQAMHKRRIVVSGFFVFGFEQDGPDVFRDTVEAIKEVDVDDANLFALTPFPGTRLYQELEAQDRLLPARRAQYGWANAVFQPRLMSPEQLEEGLQWAYDELYPHFRRKLPHVLWSQLPRLLANPRFGLGIIQGNIRRTRVR